MGMMCKISKTEPSKAFRHDDVIGPDITEHIARDFFHHVRIGLIGRKERDIPLELRAHGLEALDLEIQERGSFDQLITSFEAVAAMKRMKSKVGTRNQASKQHQHLPNAGTVPDLDFMRIGTQHGFTGLQVFWGITGAREGP